MQLQQAAFQRSIAALLCTVLVLIATPSSATSGLAATAPTQLNLVATVGGASTAVAATGVFAVVGDGAGIVVYDVRGATPVGVHRLMLPGLVQSIALVDTLLAVAVDATVFLYRLDGPIPRPLSRIAAPAAVNHLAIDSGRLYLATRAGLSILDVGDPARPTQLGLLQRTLGVRRVIADAATVYALATYEAIPWSGLSSVIKLDATDPRAPRLLHESALSGQFSNGVALARHGDAVFVAGDKTGPSMTGAMTFEIWQFTAANLAAQGEPVSYPATLSNESATDLLASDAYLFAVSAQGGLSVIDPTTRQRVAQLRTPNRLTALAIAAGRAFAAAYEGGLQPISLANPQAPAPEPFQDLLGPTSALGWYNTALMTLSPNDAAPGQIVSSFALRAGDDPQPGEQVVVGGLGALTLDSGDQGIHLLYDRSTDLTRLIDAREAGRIRLSGELRLGPSDAIAVHDQYAYVGISGPGTQDGALVIFDLRTFSAPQEVNRIALNSAVSDLTIVGSRLYLLDAIQEMQIYALDDPLAPVTIGEIAIPDRYLHLAVTGTVAYVTRTNGVQIVDVSDPRNPVLGGVVADSQAYPRIAVSAGRLAVVSTFCTTDCTLQIYDVVDPRAPTLLAEAALPPPFDQVGGLAGNAGHFALARTSHGISVYSLPTQTEIVWLPLIRS